MFCNRLRDLAAPLHDLVVSPDGALKVKSIKLFSHEVAHR